MVWHAWFWRICTLLRVMHSSCVGFCVYTAPRYVRKSNLNHKAVDEMMAQPRSNGRQRADFIYSLSLSPSATGVSME